MTVLKLDHVSLAVPELRSAMAQLHRFGFRVKATPEAAERHSRLHLDRAYLEVSTPADAVPSAWEARLFFFRFDDRAQAQAELLLRGLASRPREYRGVDGTWEELELERSERPAPILVRRTEPPAVAAGWPPPLESPHPNGALTLERVELESTTPAALSSTLEALVAPSELASNVRVRGAKTDRIAGVVFGVADVGETARFFAAAGVAARLQERELAISSAETGAVQLRFAARGR